MGRVELTGGYDKSSQVKSSQVKSSQVELTGGYDKSSQVVTKVKSSQVKSGRAYWWLRQVNSSRNQSQVKSSQVRSSQVKSSQVELTGGYDGNERVDAATLDDLALYRRVVPGELGQRIGRVRLHTLEL